MEEAIIKAENISKYYRLGQINTGMLYKDIQSYFARKMGKQDPHLRLDESNLDKDGFWALKDINFEISQGQRVGIIGRNGAGKSTLLKVLSQITSPTTGQIEINGRVASLLEVGTGFHPEMTGRENIYLNGAILGMKRSEINEKINQIIEFSEIEKHIDTPVKRYSSGMFVRLAFAVAAHLDSDILIADEVLAVGDATFQKKALGKMNSLSNEQGRTVLFVSHQMNAVKALCDTGIVLGDGKIIKSGALDDCIAVYQKELYATENTDDLSKYDNEYFDLLEYELIDASGKPADSVIMNNQEAYIRIRFNLKKLHEAFLMGIEVTTNDGIVVFRSDFKDNMNNFKEPHLGENSLRVRIPNHLLNEGDYNIQIHSSIQNTLRIVEPSVGSPRIKLTIQGGLSESPFWIMKRPGMCAPILNWIVDK